MAPAGSLKPSTLATFPVPVLTARLTETPVPPRSKFYHSCFTRSISRSNYDTGKPGGAADQGLGTEKLGPRPGMRPDYKHIILRTCL